MSLKLKSGFTFDYDNLYGEGKVTEADLKSYEEDLKKAHEAMKVMRETGFIRAHLSRTANRRRYCSLRRRTLRKATSTARAR